MADEPNVLTDAERVTSEDRPGIYGHPLDHFGRTSAALNARFFSGDDPLFRRPIEPNEWPLMVAIDKLCGRGEKTYDIERDTLVDVPGYCRTIEMMAQEFDRREPVEE